MTASFVAMSTDIVSDETPPPSTTIPHSREELPSTSVAVTAS
jgi:hypothetical protein